MRCVVVKLYNLTLDDVGMDVSLTFNAHKVESSRSGVPTLTKYCAQVLSIEIYFLETGDSDC